MDFTFFVYIYIQVIGYAHYLLSCFVDGFMIFPQLMPGLSLNPGIFLFFLIQLPFIIGFYRSCNLLKKV